MKQITRQEAYAKAKNALEMSMGEQRLASAILVSAAGLDGRPEAALKLAQAFAQEPGCKVLLVEGDLQHAPLDGKMEAVGLPGLLDLLKNMENISDQLEKYLVSLKHGQLMYLPSGNRDEYIPGQVARKDVKKLMLLLTDRFDTVVTDGPSVLNSADGVLLCACMNAGVLVVDAQKTRKADARQAVLELEEQQAPLKGTLLINVAAADMIG